jgi:hypothetical protein
MIRDCRADNWQLGETRDVFMARDAEHEAVQHIVCCGSWRRHEVRVRSRGVTDIVRELQKAGEWAVMGPGR